MLLALASAKGSPGTSTTAHALAAVWPAPVLLVDADPAGSDLVYRLRDSSQRSLDADRGLLSLAAAVRRSPQAVVREHVTLVEGGLEVLVGMTRPEQASAVASNWGSIAALLRLDRDVIADVGRLTPGSPSLPVVLAADLVIFVVRPGVDSYAHLRDRLSWLVEETSRRSERPNLGVVLVAPWKQTREASGLERLLRSSGLQVPVLGIIAADAVAADSLAGRKVRSVRRSLLVRSARALATQIATDASRMGVR